MAMGSTKCNALVKPEEKAWNFDPILLQSSRRTAIIQLSKFYLHFLQRKKTTYPTCFIPWDSLGLFVLPCFFEYHISWRGLWKYDSCHIIFDAILKTSPKKQGFCCTFFHPWDSWDVSWSVFFLFRKSWTPRKEVTSDGCPGGVTIHIFHGNPGEVWIHMEGGWVFNDFDDMMVEGCMWCVFF